MKNEKEKTGTNRKDPEHKTWLQRWNDDNKIVMKELTNLKDPDSWIMIASGICLLMLLAMLYIWAFVD